MPQSLAQLYVHLVFSTKGRVPLIKSEIAAQVHAYLAGTCHAIDCPAIIVGGVADHVHILFRLSKNASLADAVKHIKVESSKRMKDEFGCRDFAWQGGYGGFSVGASQIEAVSDYIREQPQHHAKRTFQEELRELLKRYNVTFDEAYVWD